MMTLVFVFLLSMEHRGEIIERAIRKSGIPITLIVKKLNRSRQWMYILFDNPNVPYETVLEIGKIIHHDFSDEIKQINMLLSDYQSTYEKTDNHSEDWREKYYTLLEKHNRLLDEYNKLLKKKK